MSRSKSLVGGSSGLTREEADALRLQVQNLKSKVKTLEDNLADRDMLCQKLQKKAQAAQSFAAQRRNTAGPGASATPTLSREPSSLALKAESGDVFNKRKIVTEIGVQCVAEDPRESEQVTATVAAAHLDDVDSLKIALDALKRENDFLRGQIDDFVASGLCEEPSPSLQPDCLRRGLSVERMNQTDQLDVEVAVDVVGNEARAAALSDVVTKLQQEHAVEVIQLKESLEIAVASVAESGHKAHRAQQDRKVMEDMLETTQRAIASAKSDLDEAQQSVRMLSAEKEALMQEIAFLCDTLGDATTRAKEAELELQHMKKGSSSSPQRKVDFNLDAPKNDPSATNNSDSAHKEEARRMWDKLQNMATLLKKVKTEFTRQLEASNKRTEEYRLENELLKARGQATADESDMLNEKKEIGDSSLDVYVDSGDRGHARPARYTSDVLSHSGTTPTSTCDGKLSSAKHQNDAATTTTTTTASSSVLRDRLWRAILARSQDDDAFCAMLSNIVIDDLGMAGTAWHNLQKCADDRDVSRTPPARRSASRRSPTAEKDTNEEFRGAHTHMSTVDALQDQLVVELRERERLTRGMSICRREHEVTLREFERTVQQLRLCEASLEDVQESYKGTPRCEHDDATVKLLDRLRARVAHEEAERRGLEKELLRVHDVLKDLRIEVSDSRVALFDFNTMQNALMLALRAQRCDGELLEALRADRDRLAALLGNPQALGDAIRELQGQCDGLRERLVAAQQQSLASIISGTDAHSGPKPDTYIVRVLKEQLLCEMMLVQRLATRGSSSDVIASDDNKDRGHMDDRVAQLERDLAVTRRTLCAVMVDMQEGRDMLETLIATN